MTTAQMKRRLKIILAPIARLGLNNRNFSIMSNNCWGGRVYDFYHLPYLTPTIGLWMGPKDYLQFLTNLQFYLNIEMKIQITVKDSKYKDLLIKRFETGRYDFQEKDMIIGKIGDIEIFFLHYKSFEEAAKKWNARRLRVNLSNLLVKMNDQNGCCLDDVNNFISLPFEHKIFFTSNKNFCIDKCVFYVKKYAKANYVVDDGFLSKKPFVKNLLNSLPQGNR